MALIFSQISKLLILFSHDTTSKQAIFRPSA